jgi:peptidyl-prolyl cis-trans isomerase C
MSLARSLLATAALFAATSCAQEAADVARVADALGPGQVATVDGKRIPESVFRLYTLNAARRNADELVAEERQRLIEDLVYLLVLVNEGESRGIPSERSMAAELELIRWQAIARAMTLRYREENPATETEIRALYEENLPRLASTQYKARHILVETEELAAELIDRLDAGGNFATLANEHSKDGDGTAGGDLGWLTAESMGEPLAAVVRTLAAGAYSQAPVQTEYGWHVILLEESREQPAPDLESLRAELTAAVERQKLDGFLNQLREAAEVTIE